MAARDHREDCAVSVVELRGVSRVFPTDAGPVVAVHDVDLIVQAGEWVAITGPSGSGKTTLLNLIAGLDRASEGSVFVLGQNLNRLSEVELTAHRAQHLSLVFQDPHLLPGLTAIENVVAARLPWGHAVDLEKRARDLLARVGLDHRLDFPPARLSGGERQRVGIARALLGTPQLLLADEPTGNLDHEATFGLLELLTTVQSEMGLTLVVATHDPLVASRAGRVLHLRDGRARGPVPGLDSPAGQK
jgi:predicted ABC-type transport system involved in lysophospholipase L1 biosynthesis ATPase subunit